MKKDDERLLGGMREVHRVELMADFYDYKKNVETFRTELLIIGVQLSI